MNVEDLMGLGLTRNEAAVYLALAQRGSSDARTLVRDLRFHKKIVYDNLYRLMDRGIISSVVLDDRQRFSAQEPTALLALVDRETTMIEERKRLAQRLVKEMGRMKQESTIDQYATMLVGTEGVRKAFQDCLRAKKPYCSFGAPSASVDTLGEHFWRNHHLRQAELKVKGRLIFNSSLKTWAASMSRQWNQVRFLPNVGEPNTQTITYGTRVLIVVWTKKPVAFVIDDASVAESYRSFFDVLWEQALEP